MLSLPARHPVQSLRILTSTQAITGIVKHRTWSAHVYAATQGGLILRFSVSKCAYNNHSRIACIHAFTDTSFTLTRLLCVSPVIHKDKGVWSCTQHQCTEYSGHLNHVRALAFTNNTHDNSDLMFASGSDDGSVKVHIMYFSICRKSY